MESVYGPGLLPVDVSGLGTGMRSHGAVSLVANACAVDTLGVAPPRAEVHVVARFGAAARDGLDLHALGPRQRTLRKRLRGGMRTLIARLPLGAHEAVLGVPGAALADRTVPLDALWGDDAHRLSDALRAAHDMGEAAALLDRAVTARGERGTPSAHTMLAVEAAARLTEQRVQDVAHALGVSERNLRRVFREVVGMGPKEFAKLSRFQRALGEARTHAHVDWARIAVSTGYYDQAHLIAEFRDLAGVTPRALLCELGPTPT